MPAFNPPKFDWTQSGPIHRLERPLVELYVDFSEAAKPGAHVPANVAFLINCTAEDGTPIQRAWKFITLYFQPGTPVATIRAGLEEQILNTWYLLVASLVAGPEEPHRLAFLMRQNPDTQTDVLTHRTLAFSKEAPPSIDDIIDGMVQRELSATPGERSSDEAAATHRRAMDKIRLNAELPTAATAASTLYDVSQYTAISPEIREVTRRMLQTAAAPASDADLQKLVTDAIHAELERQQAEDSESPWVEDRDGAAQWGWKYRRVDGALNIAALSQAILTALKKGNPSDD